jgi:pSer/pThr/pTyr-binding forkhead associated (FHA) protein
MSFKPNGELVPVGGGDTIQLVREVLSMGRRESCDICIRYPNVSGVHAELHFRDGYWRIRDLNSTNGVKVNGMRVTEKLLHPHDEICISKRRFTIEYELPAVNRALEEMEEDILSQSLLEKAGLQKQRRRRPSSGEEFDASDFLLDDDE